MCESIQATCVHELGPLAIGRRQHGAAARGAPIDEAPKRLVGPDAFANGNEDAGFVNRAAEDLLELRAGGGAEGELSAHGDPFGVEIAHAGGVELEPDYDLAGVNFVAEQCERRRCRLLTLEIAWEDMDE